jgi:hypothetical protein
MNASHRPNQAFSFSQAIDNSPSLAKLAGMARASAEMLKSVEVLLPLALRSSVQAGPIDGDSWCLLVTGNAAAAKVRQLVPTLLARLQANGHVVRTIRLKVLVLHKAGAA